MAKVKKISELFDYNSNLRNEERFVKLIKNLNEEYSTKMMQIRVEYESGVYSKGNIKYEKKKDYVTFYYGHILYEDHGDYHEFEIHEKDSVLKQRLEFCVDKGKEKVNMSDICILYKFGNNIDISQKVIEYDDTIKKIVKTIINTINDLRKYKIDDE
mgnify:CR=1 FL=1